MNGKNEDLNIKLHFLQPLRLNNRQKLKKFLGTIFTEENVQLLSLDIIFCSDEYLLKINQEFLRQHDYTDVITFDLSEIATAKIGEIYISVDRVRENASKFKIGTYDELARVIIHGVLHLCGYADKKSPDKRLMREKEDHYLKKYSST